MNNVYNTTDPQKLLELKRLEADALLDVLRTINHSELSIHQLCLIARNVLRAQLGVKKMVFLYESEKGWEEGLRLGFSPFSDATLSEIQQIKEVSSVAHDQFPHLMQEKAEYVIPIIQQGAFNAYFIIADFADTEVEAQNDLIFIETLGNILAVAIRNKQLFREKMRRELLQRELEVAETIQKQLLISDFERFREFDVFGVNIPHHHIGGDFYDVIKKGKGTTFVCIADVAGKGIAAALLMSNLQANLRALCAQYTDLPMIVQELNKLLFKITSGDKFVSLFLARIDSAQRKVTYVNAGHNYPLWVHGQQVRPLSTGCLLLGIMPELKVEDEKLEYEEGDIMFMYTDGVVEQQGPEDEMFGQQRLEDGLVAARAEGSRQIVASIQDSLGQFSKNMGVNDDITLLSVKFS